MISPKWPNRVFAFELIRRIITMCESVETSKESSEDGAPRGSIDYSGDENELKKRGHFDLKLAKRLKSRQQPKNSQQEDNYLILFLQDLMRIACIGATSSCDPLKLVGLDLLNDLILAFAHVEEPNAEFKGHLVLEQYQAQVSAALRPQFSLETSAHVTAKACHVCSRWISSGIARDLNDLRRVHQLLVSSLQKLSGKQASENGSVQFSMQNTVSNDQLIYSELSLTIEKLAVLRGWAEVYIVAKHKSSSSTNTLLALVQPELAVLSYHWYVALKDYAFLCLPNGEFSLSILTPPLSLSH